MLKTLSDKYFMLKIFKRKSTQFRYDTLKQRIFILKNRKSPKKLKAE